MDDLAVFTDVAPEVKGIVRQIQKAGDHFFRFEVDVGFDVAGDLHPAFTQVDRLEETDIFQIKAGDLPGQLLILADFVDRFLEFFQGVVAVIDVVLVPHCLDRCSSDLFDTTEADDSFFSLPLVDLILGQKENEITFTEIGEADAGR